MRITNAKYDNDLKWHQKWNDLSVIIKKILLQ